MSENLGSLEREVEIARARLAQDLSVLVSPRTYSEFKQNLREEGRSSVMRVVEDLKARAAANPAAVLAIGAGLAWRLLQRPPVTAALVGAGVISLWRTQPLRLVSNAPPDYVAEGKERLKEQVGDFAESVKNRAAEMASGVAEQASELVDAASEKAQNLGAEAVSGVKQQAAALSKKAVHAVDDGWQSAAEAATRLRRSPNIDDANMRDNLLLGVAGAAVMAAVGIAYQRHDSLRPSDQG